MAHGDGARTQPQEDSDLAARKEALLQAAKAEVEDVMSRSDIPITRPQWAAWLDDNLAEFHERMKTAPLRRRAGNIRVRARSDLPAAAARLNPQAASTKCTTQWAANLAGRCGWHGLQTNASKMMFLLMSNGGVAYYIDMEPNRVETPHDVRYALTDDFDLVGQLHPLADLEATYPDCLVRGTFVFQVNSKIADPTHGVGGQKSILVWPDRGSRITAPLPKSKRNKEPGKDEDVEIDEEEEEDIVDDIIATINDDNISDSSAVADTAAESVASDCSSSSQADDGEMQPVVAELPMAHGDGARLDGAEGILRKKKDPLWDNGYFNILNNPDQTDVKIVMHSSWSHDPPGGMGSVGRSRTLTPAHYGETRSCPTRSLLLLRAWMLWRVNLNGWVYSDTGRQRHFEEEALVLERKIKALNQTSKLLGNPKADALLRSWVPDIAARLCET